MGQREKIFLESPTPIDGFNTDSARPRSTTSGEASLVWEDDVSLSPFNLRKLRHVDPSIGLWDNKVVCLPFKIHVFLNLWRDF